MTSMLLLVGLDGPAVEPLLRALEGAGRTAVRRATGPREAVELLTAHELEGVVVDRRPGERPGAIAELIEACSRAKRPVPVVVVSEEYQADEALDYFRSGVTDYLSRRDHLDQIASVIDALSDRGARGERPAPRPTRPRPTPTREASPSPIP